MYSTIRTDCIIEYTGSVLSVCQSNQDSEISLEVLLAALIRIASRFRYQILVTTVQYVGGTFKVSQPSRLFMTRRRALQQSGKSFDAMYFCVAISSSRLREEIIFKIMDRWSGQGLTELFIYSRQATWLQQYIVHSTVAALPLQDDVTCSAAT